MNIIKEVITKHLNKEQQMLFKLANNNNNVISKFIDKEGIKNELLNSINNNVLKDLVVVFFGDKIKEEMENDIEPKNNTYKQYLEVFDSISEKNTFKLNNPEELLKTPWNELFKEKYTYVYLKLKALYELSKGNCLIDYIKKDGSKRIVFAKHLLEDVTNTETLKQIVYNKSDKLYVIDLEDDGKMKALNIENIQNIKVAEDE